MRLRISLLCQAGLERQKDEFLTEAVTGPPVTKGDFEGLVSLAAQLEEHLQLAEMYGDARRFDEPENILAICEERVMFLHEKWLHHVWRENQSLQKVLRLKTDHDPSKLR